MLKVTQMIDVEAPCEEVFNTVVSIEKRMQLSPLWGISRIQKTSPNFPEPGSSYQVQVLTGAPFGLSQGTLNASHSALAGLAQVLSLKLGEGANQHAIDPPAPSAEQTPPSAIPIEQEYFVAEHEPVCKFSYYLDVDCKTFITWRFQPIPLGTRVHYEEVFCDESAIGEEFMPTVQGVVKEWLTNIKQYSELRGSRGRRFVKWWLDRVYLKLRPDQRRVILLMLVLQAIGLATFTIAAIGWGVASLFF